MPGSTVTDEVELIGTGRGGGGSFGDDGNSGGGGDDWKGRPAPLVYRSAPTSPE